MRTRRPLLLLALLLLLGGSGCFAAFFKGNSGADEVPFIQTQYMQALRKGQLEVASAWVHPDFREEFMSFEPAMKQVQIGDHDTGPPDFYEDGRVRFRVTYQIFALRSMVVKEVIEIQEWEKHPDAGWVLIPQIELLAQIGAPPAPEPGR